MGLRKKIKDLEQELENVKSVLRKMPNIYSHNVEIFLTIEDNYHYYSPIERFTNRKVLFKKDFGLSRDVYNLTKNTVLAKSILHKISADELEKGKRYFHYETETLKGAFEEGFYYIPDFETQKEIIRILNGLEEEK